MKHTLAALESFVLYWGVPQPVLPLGWALNFGDRAADVIEYVEAESIFVAIPELPIVRMALNTIKRMVLEIFNTLTAFLSLKSVKVVSQAGS